MSRLPQVSYKLCTKGNTVTNPYTTVNLQQGTAEWLEWRSNGIGASDAPTIMGENPWKSAARLLSEKLGTADKVGGNAAMARGTALEPEARRQYEAISKVFVAPICLQSNKHQWLRASLDGLAADGRTVVEIKCGNSGVESAAVSMRSFLARFSRSHDVRSLSANTFSAKA